MSLTESSAMRKVLIVEDHPIVFESLSRLISESFENLTCFHAANGNKGLSSLNGNHFDIVVLDINLPDISGIEFCRRAKAMYPSLKILAVTSIAQRHTIEESFQAGVNGFILKTSDINDITEGVKQVMEGNNYIGQGVRELTSGHPVTGTSDPVITRREHEILKLIAEGFTNQEIAEKLFISTSTVDSHRKNLLMKFDARNSAMLIKTAVEKGII